MCLIILIMLIGRHQIIRMKMYTFTLTFIPCITQLKFHNLSAKVYTPISYRNYTCPKFKKAVCVSCDYSFSVYLNILLIL